MTTIKTNEDLFKLQDGAIAMLGKGKQAMHNACLMTIRHIAKHGDRMPACRMVSSLHIASVKGDKTAKQNTQAIVDWLAYYGGLEYDKEQKTFTGWKGKEHIELLFNTARDNPWFMKLKKADKPDVFDINGALIKLAERITANKEKIAKGDKDTSQIDVNVKDEAIAALLAAIGMELEQVLIEPATVEGQLADLEQAIEEEEQALAAIMAEAV